MMNSGSVLNYLDMISNQNILLNLILHLFTYLLLAAIAISGSPKKRTLLFNSLVLLLTGSVTVTAFINGNPFHLITFALLTIVAAIAMINGKNTVTIPRINAGVYIATAFLILGLWYPEFVDTNGFALLLTSPMGIIPCPTLIVILSLFALNPHGIGKAQYLAVIVIGAVYALIGVFVLKVYLDIVLLLLVLYSAYRLLPKMERTQAIS